LVAIQAAHPALEVALRDLARLSDAGDDGDRLVLAVFGRIFAFDQGSVLAVID
jgi:hypothetical protein